jgi:hypothetical protein
MITFKEHPTFGYAARTRENATASCTIAIAKDFNTMGEVATRKAVAIARKIYHPVQYLNMIDGKSFVVSDLIHRLYGGKIDSINIAGNGIYTLQEPQHVIDEVVLEFLASFFTMWNALKIPKPGLIRSGGQTGIDEAGLKAADRLGLETLCLAPKGWLFRDINGKDIADEYLFKKRFGLQYCENIRR